MRSFETNTNEQDLRIMAVAALKNPNQKGGEQCYTVFGTSSGEVEFHLINFHKRRIEISQSSTIKLSGSVLSMKRIKMFGSLSFIIVGMSSGDIAFIKVEFQPAN